MYAVILVPLLPFLAALIVLVGNEGSRNLQAKIAAFPIFATLRPITPPIRSRTHAARFYQPVQSVRRMLGHYR